MSTISPPDRAAGALRGLCGGDVHLPGDPGYDAARTPWNVSVDLRPAAVAVPRSAQDVVDVVRAARSAGLRVAPMSTGHAAAPLAGRVEDAVLLRLHGLTGVAVDAERRVARVLGGTIWQDVVEAAAPHGLAALHGSSPDVAVTGYTLGGGLSWFGRSHGLACHHVVAIEVVTSDGVLRRVDATHDEDLFWALRGGGGGFGVVTAIEIALLAVADVHAGLMLWPGQMASEVTHAWARWTRRLPVTVTSSLRLLSFPAMPELPPFLSGRQVVVMDAVLQEDDHSARLLLQPLRDLAPEMDTFGRVPAGTLTRLHMDPEGPTPSAGGHVLVDSLPPAAVDAFVAAAGPGSGTSLLAAELRHLGGALGRSPRGAGALGHLRGEYAAFFVGIAATPEMGAAAAADAARAVAALEPWSRGRVFPNFAEEGTELPHAHRRRDWARLRKVAAAVDPDGLLVANHPVR